MNRLKKKTADMRGRSSYGRHQHYCPLHSYNGNLVFKLDPVFFLWIRKYSAQTHKYVYTCRHTYTQRTKRILTQEFNIIQIIVFKNPSICVTIIAGIGMCKEQSENKKKVLGIINIIAIYLESLSPSLSPSPPLSLMHAHKHKLQPEILHERILCKTCNSWWHTLSH